MIEQPPLAPCEKCGCEVCYACSVTVDDVVLKNNNEIYLSSPIVQSITFTRVCTYCGDADYHNEIRFENKVIENNQNNILIVMEWPS